jgi:hypothetical protein
MGWGALSKCRLRFAVFAGFGMRPPGWFAVC